MSISQQNSWVKYTRIRKCAICGISNKNENVTMHRAPRNKEIKNLWCKAVNMELSSSALICSNHFKKSDYRYSVGKRYLLKPHAVPITQFNRNIIGVQNQTSLVNVKNLNNNETLNLGNEQNIDTNSENHLSNQENENDYSDKELCYIYYLDEKQNISVFESSASYYDVGNGNICSNSSDTNQIINPSNVEISQKDSLNMDLGMIQSITDSGTEEQSLKSNTLCTSVLQSQSLEPDNVVLNLSDFTTEHAWQTFRHVISEYRGQIHDLKNLNDILQKKVTCLEELSDSYVNKIYDINTVH